MKRRIGQTQTGWEHVLALCPEAVEWRLGASIEINEVKRRRSVEANNLYWVIVSALADYAGYTKAEMHEEILCEHFGFDLVEFRGSTRKHPRCRSSKLTTVEFSELMGVAERWCAEAGVHWDREAA